MLNETKLYKLCYSIAEKAHLHQFRKDGITPYIEHPKAVAEYVAHELDGGETLRCAAILHDVMEDAFLTRAELQQKGVPIEVVNLVDILSRRKGESYFDYMMRVLDDEGACTVKYADLTHNMSDLAPGSLKDKYELSRYIIKKKWW